MRRLIWIVPSVFAVALSGYLLGWPTTAPADPNHPDPAAGADTARLASPPAAPSSPELPVTQIVLYSSGVGFFQREGYVQGNARVDLSFPVQDVNDLLKSMVLQDLDGGRVSAVSYESNDPIDRTLKSLAIHLTKNPTRTQIFNQARGEKVIITVIGTQAGNASAVETVQGTIMGIEVNPPASKDEPAVESLNLWCVEGVRSVPLADIQRTKFLNPAVENQVGRAFEGLTHADDNPKKGFSLHCLGSGTRSVRVGYVSETALWRTSYRLLVGTDGKLFVQGWALVDNPTDDDWTNVRMALVSGQPISFKVDLYKPLFASRPVVQQQQHVVVQPTVYNAPKLTTQMPPMPSVQPTAVTMPAPSAGQPMAVPQMGSTPWQPPAISDKMNLPNAPPVQPIDLQSETVAAAKVTDLGSSFEYAIDCLVTIPRQKSALVPIVTSAVEGDKVSVYNPNAHAKHPLLALRFRNTTGLHLMQGPVAIFEGSNYCGDSQMADLQPMDERLLSYAVDVGTEVEITNTGSTDEPLSLRLSKGYLTLSGKAQESKTYTVKNRSTQDRVVLIEHPFRSNFWLISQLQPKERAADVSRFEVKVAGGETVKLEIVEEREYQQPIPLRGIAVNQVRNYMEWNLSNGEIKSALAKLLEFQDSSAKILEERASVVKQLDDLNKDQQRLRNTLKETPLFAASYKRYLERFDFQELAIENCQVQIQTINDRAQKSQQELEAYVNSLDVETTIGKSPPGK